MEVKIIYSKERLDSAVDFIAEHNTYFYGKHDAIRKSILKDMKRIAKDPEQFLTGTMGYVLWGDREFEGIDCDQSTIHFDISVNPNLGYDDDETYIEEVIT